MAITRETRDGKLVTVGTIENVQDLCDFLGADEPSRLNRAIYDGTDCGASITIYLNDGRTYHNGSRFPSVEEIEAAGGLHGFTIQTIIEGSDATVDSDEFVLPVDGADVDNWIEEMEAEANSLWHEANDEVTLELSAEEVVAVRGILNEKHLAEVRGVLDGTDIRLERFGIKVGYDTPQKRQAALLKAVAAGAKFVPDGTKVSVNVTNLQDACDVFLILEDGQGFNEHVGTISDFPFLNEKFLAALETLGDE